MDRGFTRRQLGQIEEYGVRLLPLFPVHAKAMAAAIALVTECFTERKGPEPYPDTAALYNLQIAVTRRTSNPDYGLVQRNTIKVLQRHKGRKINGTITGTEISGTESRILG